MFHCLLFIVNSFKHFLFLNVTCGEAAGPRTESCWGNGVDEIEGSHPSEKIGWGEKDLFQIKFGKKMVM